jgi:hypothetical protein
VNSNNNNNNDFLPALTQPMAKLEVNSTNRQIHMEVYILNCPMKTTGEWDDFASLYEDW